MVHADAVGDLDGSVLGHVGSGRLEEEEGLSGSCVVELLDVSGVVAERRGLPSELARSAAGRGLALGVGRYRKRRTY